MVGRIEGIIKFRILCLRPLGCSKAQEKEKLRGVAGIKAMPHVCMYVCMYIYFSDMDTKFIQLHNANENN